MLLYIYLTCKHFAGYYLGQRYYLWFVRWSSKIGQQTWCVEALWRFSVSSKVKIWGCVISLWRTLFLCFSVYFSWIVVFLHKGNLIILYRNFTFLVLSITKQPQSSQKGIVIPDDKKNKIEFYRFIPKYFFKLNPIPNNPRSM